MVPGLWLNGRNRRGVIQCYLTKGTTYGDQTPRLCNMVSRKRKKGGKRYVPGGKCSLHPHICRCFSTADTRPRRSGHRGKRCRNCDQQDTRGRAGRCSTSLDDAIGGHGGYLDALCSCCNANDADPVRYVDCADLSTAS